VTRIEWDGTMQRRVVDTAQRDNGPQWEDLTTRALAVLPPYTPLPRTPIYHVSVDDQVILAAEHDLTGPQLDLVTAVLAIGGAVLARSPGPAKHSYAVAERSRSTAAGARRSAATSGSLSLPGRRSCRAEQVDLCGTLWRRGTEDVSAKEPSWLDGDRLIERRAWPHGG
jgi:hypothetical protein